MPEISAFPWLPLGHEIATGVAVGRVVHAGEDHQILRAREADTVIFLARANVPLGNALSGLPAKNGVLAFHPLAYGPEAYLVATFDADQEPFQIADRPRRPAALTAAEAARLADALSVLAQRNPDAAWESAIFFPSLDICVPTEQRIGEDRRLLATRLLTGGIADPSLSARQIHGANPWITVDEIDNFMRRFGVAAQRPTSPAASAKAPFRLPGNPRLETLFREYVIEYYGALDRYRAMRVDPPGGFLLHGPTGSGKTHAARALASYLGWPVFEIDIGKIGSPFIHHTTIQLRRAFEEAAAKAPALIILNEFDALAGSRTPGTLDHKIEEVGELLQLLETAASKNVVLVATTNRRHAIDEAILRRGRFDHLVLVDYPDETEVREAMQAMLAERPHAAGLNLDMIAAKLTKRPMSDIAWTINEAARMAVRTNKPQIDDICLFQALAKLTSQPKPRS
jgi:cell division protease FtsH